MVVLATPQPGASRFESFFEGGGVLPSINGAGEPDEPRRRMNANPRLNHLGKPKYSKGSSLKYLRSGLSLAYDFKDSPKKHQKVLLHSLINDARKSADLSLPKLARMYELFTRAAHDAGVTLVGPRAFGLVLRQLGIVDLVLADRLFSAYAERYGGQRLDYREFLRSFICVCGKSPIEGRLSLLFDVYDVDGSGALSLLELTSILAPVEQSPVFNAPNASAQSPGERVRHASLAASDEGRPVVVTPPRVDYKRMLDPETLSTLEQVWALAREIQARDASQSDVWAVDARSANGVYKSHLLQTLAESPMAKSFFSRHLTTTQPAEVLVAAKLPHGAGDGELRHFYQRLTQLDCEVINEVHGADVVPSPAADKAEQPADAAKGRKKGGGSQGSSLLKKSATTPSVGGRTSTGKASPRSPRASRRRSGSPSRRDDDKGGEKSSARGRSSHDESHDDEPPRSISPRERARILGVKRDTAITLSRRSAGRGLRAEADRKIKTLSDSAAQLVGTNWGEHVDKPKSCRPVDEHEAGRILKYLNRSRSKLNFPPIQNDIRDLTARKKYANDARFRASGYATTPSGSLSLSVSQSLPALL